jgi:hypothetical protein
MSGRTSEAELAVMEVLWRESPLTALDVAERIDPARGWSKRTAKTMLGRLLAKGVMAHEEGRRYLHRPVAAAFGARVAHALWLLPALRMMLLVLREWTSPLLPGSSPVDPVVAVTFAAPVVAGRANVAPAAMLDLVPLLALAWLAESVIWFGGQMLRYRRIVVRCVKKRRWRRARWSSPNSASDREKYRYDGHRCKNRQGYGRSRHDDGDDPADHRSYPGWRPRLYCSEYRPQRRPARQGICQHR